MTARPPAPGPVRCVSCGHPIQDEAEAEAIRLLSRFIRQGQMVLCPACERRKGDKPYEQWLDDEWELSERLKEPRC